MDNLHVHLPGGKPILSGMGFGLKVFAGDIWRFQKAYHFTPYRIACTGDKWIYEPIPKGATFIVEYRNHYDGEYTVRWIHGGLRGTSVLPMGREYYQEMLKRIVRGSEPAVPFIPVPILLGVRPSTTAWKAEAKAKAKARQKED